MSPDYLHAADVQWLKALRVGHLFKPIRYFTAGVPCIDEVRAKLVIGFVVRFGK